MLQSAGASSLLFSILGNPMELCYPGKLPFDSIVRGARVPFSAEIDPKRSALIEGDNLSVLRSLLDRSIRFDLCYIDPPFATGHVFRQSEERSSTISPSAGSGLAYGDLLKGSAFIEFMRQRIILIRELLTEEGSFYLHTDDKIGHYLKIILDEVFGVRHFRNDISRIKCNPKNFQRKAYGNSKDVIYFYSKSKKNIWNDPREGLADMDVKQLFRKIDGTGRRYTTVPVHAPGETLKGATAQPWRGLLPPPGRHWRAHPDELERLNQQGLLEWSAKGNPRRILYADEHTGKKVQDSWIFKDPPYPRYPTEKNPELLLRIIAASSRPDSWVLDCFAGSGTTLAACQQLGRCWLGVDQSPAAIDTIRKRFAAMQPAVDYQFIAAGAGTTPDAVFKD